MHLFRQATCLYHVSRPMADGISSSPQPPTLVTLNLICRMEWTDSLAYEYEFMGKDGIRQLICAWFMVFFLIFFFFSKSLLNRSIIMDATDSGTVAVRLWKKFLFRFVRCVEKKKHLLEYVPCLYHCACLSTKSKAPFAVKLSDNWPVRSYHAVHTRYSP